jgi:hypothetical protein
MARIGTGELTAMQDELTELTASGAQFGDAMRSTFADLAGGVSIPISWDGGTPPALPGFAGGTHGRLLDFGEGTPVMLHGREGVVTEGDARAGSGGAGGVLAELQALRGEMARDRQSFPMTLARAVRDEVQKASGGRR